MEASRRDGTGWLAPIRTWIGERWKPLAVLALVGTTTAGWAVTRALDAASSRIGQVVNEPVNVAIVSGPFSFQRVNSLPPSFIVPLPPGEIPDAPPEWEEERSPWAYGLGGIDADVTEVQVVVEGTSSSPVILQGLRVRVLERRQPATGTLVSQLGGDLVDVRYVDIDLDQQPPALTLGSGYTPGEGAWQFPLRVSSTEPEVLHLFATTETCDCSWVADLHYLHRGREGTVTIDHNGQPFRTTTSSAATDRVTVLPEGTLQPAEA